ncbi:MULTISPECIES: response regulator transcription factor [Streptomyces]|uniref:DNA-binding response regulator n=2 Tax=Streptomyces TaxID=1883 RepID=A0A420V279_9ACTN|nr:MULTISPECIES: response regulator transcription factor [Streptomyces]KNE82883.1 LuxR family transcriptional regulator [Streptomyces fradiae]OFA48732.1 DNA-binding response regulator [Streptomyces fradiae]PQM23367.1 DNA-binding response regulator [Streptomyces xinghaiensis]RKM94932.1 DNA-binding response regulator [Streptomyces xinghaiensis]RNC74629.1 DNA-binding response regulator [Streptomyces xinghaiensis]
MIRVLLVDDQRLVRAGLRMLCEAAPDVLVVGEAEDGRRAVDLAGELRPDVILMDLRMPLVDGITATGRILAAHPATRVVALTTFDDDDHLYPALAAGACGFLVKDAAPAELLDGIRRAAEGDDPFSTSVLRRLVGRAVRARNGEEERRPAPPADLTRREREVLSLLGAGLSNGEIAERLHLGVTTVKTHVSSLMTKTGATNRVRLAVLAARAGVTPPR